MYLKSKSLLLGLGIVSSLLYVQCSTDFEEPEKAEISSEALMLRGHQRYVIILEEGEDLESLEDVRGIGKGILKKISANQEPDHLYASALKGFTAYLSPGQVKKLLKNEKVISVELDAVISLGPPPGKGWNKEETTTEDPVAEPSQTTPWGITRVNGGITATDKLAWILDSGIDLDHPDLNVDRSLEFTAYTRGRNAGTGDKNGHGTHVAGTIAALDNNIGVIGVAAGAKVVPVKVLDASGSGSWSGILAGVDHVARYGSPGDVANMSIGGGIYQTLDNAIINAAQTSGVKFVIAAGNSSEDTNNSSPGRANGPNVYTISAMDVNDRFASFSNYGSPVDYCAPGVNVLSTWTNGGYHTISGTSMATPHAAGLMLLGPTTTDGYVQNDPDGNPDPIIVR